MAVEFGSMTSTVIAPSNVLTNPATANGTAFPTSSRTQSRTARRRSRWLFGLGGVALLAAVVAIIWSQAPRVQRTDLLYHRVHREPLELTVVERGALESADNRDVVCRVRAGTKASQLTI